MGLILNDADAAAEEGDRDVDRAVLGLEVVVEGIFAGDKGRFEFLGGGGNAFDALDKATEFIGIIGIAHAEVIEQSDLVGVGTDDNERAHGFGR